MRHLLCILILAALRVAPLVAEEAAADPATDGPPRVEIVTSKGAIVVEVYPDKAPKTVEAFLGNVESHVEIRASK